MNALLSRVESPSGPGRLTHPKAYQRRFPLLWWHSNPRYTLYMFREASSVSLAVWLLLMLRQLDQVRKGPEAYRRFVQRLRSPFWLLFNLFNLGVALIHSYTWLSLTAQVLPIPQGIPLPKPAQLSRVLIGGWVGLSVAIALPFLLGGLKNRGEPMSSAFNPRIGTVRLRSHAHEAGAEVWWWGLFAAGGMISALVGPVLMFLQGVAGPLGLPTAAMRYERMRWVVSNPLLKLALFAFSAFSFIYSGHRIRRYLPDLGLRSKSPIIGQICYGLALLGALRAALVVSRIPGKPRG